MPNKLARTIIYAREEMPVASFLIILILSLHLLKYQKNVFLLFIIVLSLHYKN
jgi:hypothetical protein